MIEALGSLTLSALTLMLTAYLLSGIKVKSFGSAMIAAFVIGLANAVVRPLLMFLTLPLNILTLGLFTFVVNAIVLKIAARLVPGFDIEKFMDAVWAAIVIALINVVAGMIFF